MKNIKDQNVLQQLTTEEKLRLTTGDGFWQTAGVERLDVFPVTFADGPVGLRKEQNGETVTAVAFPSISKLACSFDPAVLREVGAAVGEQCRQEGVKVLLAPGINIKRNPRCGRNFEYFSEDPFLTAELANAYITGVNSQEVGVCVKHFAGNNQEYGRRVCDSVIDERALREIYLAAFERVIKQSKPCAVMCSYNKLNGEYCSQNKRLLTDILRTEWEFPGIVISDWGATDDRAKGLAAGLDLQMPQGDLSAVANAFADGMLCENDLDVAVSRVLQLAEDFSEQTPRNADFNYQHNLVRKISADCTVLAKNTCNLLPFSKSDKIALVGELAEEPYFQGGGSSKVHAYKVDTLKHAFEQSHVKFEYAAGYKNDGSFDEKLLEQARQVAERCEKVLVVVGGYGCDNEGADRDTFFLPECQLKLLDVVTSVNSNVAVVVQSGAPVDISWHHSAKALIISYLDGENCGGIFDVVFGDVCPTGRLAETWPLYLPEAEKKYSADYKRALYRESIYVGYRYYTTANVPVAFPFGFGLNYNKFVWNNVQISNSDVLPVGKLTVTLDIANCGKTEDADTVQIYVTNCEGRDFYAKKNLVAFKKVRLKGGEKKTVSLNVNVQDFASFDVNKGQFAVNGGKYLLTVAHNCNDAGVPLEVRVACENDSTDNSEKYPCYYNIGADFCPTVEQFAELYGELPQETVLPFTINSPLCEISAKRFGKHVVRSWTKNSDNARTLLSLPLVDFISLRKDVSQEILLTIVDILNGTNAKSYFKNIFKLICQHHKLKKSNKKKKNQF